MNDWLIYFGLPDFILYTVALMIVCYAAGWWVSRRQHRQETTPDAILDSLPYGAILLRHDGQMLTVNAEAKKLWNLPPPPGLAPHALAALAGEARQEGGHWMRTLDAPSGASLRVWAAVVDAGATLLILEDFSARKQQEGFYRNFISNVSHELKTPLTVIQGHASALDHGGKADDPRHTSLRIITQETARLTQLVENLLWLSRLEMPDFIMERKPVNMEAVVENSILQLSDLAEARGISLNLQTTGPLPRILADQSRLKQVCINLLDNAIKYNHDGGTITVSLDADEHNVICRISDSGEGIPEEDLPHIFEKLYRVARPQGRYVEGSGLGLSIVRRIIEQHRGSISVQSEPVKGTTFTLLLPHGKGNREQG
ncbi:MAG: GHKL domain-containing protein [Anaerolineae bacterium]|nr:GHKL domain-containing protein [Anaerolineae bacterium]